IPKGLREELSGADILSYRILSYERNRRGFIRPGNYPRLALACVSTHDHQTMAGWWDGKDVAMRAEHGLVPEEAAEAQRQERTIEQQDIRKAFKSVGIALPDEAGTTRDEFIAALVTGAYRYLA